MNDLPPRWNGDEFHTLPTRPIEPSGLRRRAQPLVVLVPLVWAWRLLERVWWRVHEWRCEGRTR